MGQTNLLDLNLGNLVTQMRDAANDGPTVVATSQPFYLVLNEGNPVITSCHTDVNRLANSLDRMMSQQL